LKHTGLKLSVVHLLDYFFLNDRVFQKVAGIRSDIFISNALERRRVFLICSFVVSATSR